MPLKWFKQICFLKLISLLAEGTCDWGGIFSWLRSLLSFRHTWQNHFSYVDKMRTVQYTQEVQEYMLSFVQMWLVSFHFRARMLPGNITGTGTWLQCCIRLFFSAQSFYGLNRLIRLLRYSKLTNATCIERGFPRRALKSIIQLRGKRCHLVVFDSMSMRSK